LTSPVTVVVEVWYRRKRGDVYRSHGKERVEALLEVGAPMTVKVDGKDRRVTVDQVARIAISIAAVATLWVTEV
jgi:hypothetical protein